MSQVQVSVCPQCGAPIYNESPWFSITPPPPIYTCMCNAASRRTITTDCTNCYVDDKGEVHFTV